MMISFHFPPSAAHAAVSGQPATWFGRTRSLPEGAYCCGAGTATYPSGMTADHLNSDDSPPSASRQPVVEVRTYCTKPGRRAEFVELFQSRGGPAQRECGITVVGPL